MTDRTTQFVILGFVTAIIIAGIILYNKSSKENYDWIPTPTLTVENNYNTQLQAQVIAALGKQARDAGVAEALGASSFGSTYGFMEPSSMDEKEKKRLVDKWYNFIDRTPDQVQDAIYSLFSAIPTRLGLEVYGFSQEMGKTLKEIEPLLYSPELLQTYDDVLARFSKAAVKMEGNITGVKFTPNAEYAPEKEAMI